MKNEALRDELINKAEYGFVMLMTQVDALFDLAGIYLDNHPNDTPSVVLKNRELKTTVDNIAALSGQLAEVIKRFKNGEERVLSRLGTEVYVLNELWANVQALIYFLKSHDIDLESYNEDMADHVFGVLVKCNQLLA